MELLDSLDHPDVDDNDDDAGWLLRDAFDRAAWSFHAGPGPRYAATGSLARNLARLRAREWFLFECELPSGLTAAEEWVADREDEPGSDWIRRAVRRFVNSECGLFDVLEVSPSGWLHLAPLPDGAPVRARTISTTASRCSPAWTTPSRSFRPATRSVRACIGATTNVPTCPRAPT